MKGGLFEAVCWVHLGEDATSRPRLAAHSTQAILRLDRQHSLPLSRQLPVERLTLMVVAPDRPGELGAVDHHPGYKHSLA